jgi:YggT family protein
MPNPIVYFISQLIDLYIFVLIADIVVSWLTAANVLNRSQPLVAKSIDVLNRLTEPALRPIRKLLPDLGGIDVSPVIAILGLHFINYAIFYYLG